MKTGNESHCSNDQKSYFDVRSKSFDRAFFTPTGGAIKRRFNVLQTLFVQKSTIPCRILEIGTGSGIFTSYLSALHAKSITAGDISFQMLQQTKSKNLQNVSLIQYNAEQLPFADSSFDTIITFASIHHLKNLDSFFSECYRTLSSDGLLFAMEPNPLFPLNAIIGLADRYERGMLHSWPVKLIRAAQKQSFRCCKLKHGSFFPGKPKILEGLYSKLEPVLEKIPVVNNFSIFVYYCFSKNVS